MAPCRLSCHRIEMVSAVGLRFAAGRDDFRPKDFRFQRRAARRARGLRWATHCHFFERHRDKKYGRRWEERARPARSSPPRPRGRPPPPGARRRFFAASGYMAGLSCHWAIGSARLPIFFRIYNDAKDFAKYAASQAWHYTLPPPRGAEASALRHAP